MMMLIGLAITIAYVYSVFVVFGFDGHNLFWELATLVDIMLLGHWIEMRSVMGASNALEKLVALLPNKANKVEDNGDIKEVPLDSLLEGDKVVEIGRAACRERVYGAGVVGDGYEQDV